MIGPITCLLVPRALDRARGAPHGVKTTFPTSVALGHGGEALARFGQREHAVDARAHAAQVEQPHELRRARSRVPMVEPSTRSWRKNSRCSSADGAWPEVAPDTTSAPPGFSDAQRVLPGRLPHRLQHRVDALGQPRAGLERLVRAELVRGLALGLVAARRPTRARPPRGPARSPPSPRRRRRPGPARSGPGCAAALTNSIR